MSIDPKYYGLIEMGMTFGIVAIFIIQQLWSLRDRPDASGNPDASGMADDEPKI